MTGLPPPSPPDGPPPDLPPPRDPPGSEPEPTPFLRVRVVAVTSTRADPRPTHHELGSIVLLGDDRHGWRARLAGGLREVAALVDEAPVTSTDRRELRDVQHRAEYYDDGRYPDQGDDVRFLLRLLERLAPDLEED